MASSRPADVGHRPATRFLPILSAVEVVREGRIGLPSLLFRVLQCAGQALEDYSIPWFGQIRGLNPGHIHLMTDQIGRQSWQLVVLSICPTVLYFDVLTLVITGYLEPCRNAARRVA
jgi:hypothetical protein